MTIKDIAIVIPMHRSDMKWNELVSMQRCSDLYKDYPVFMICPEGMDVSAYEKYNVIKKYIHTAPKYFKSEEMYNQMLLEPFFYKHFLDYEYMLIYQLDTFVFENNLLAWCEKGYDYIGAPWIDADFIRRWKKKIPHIDKFVNKVGNGGLSLRRTRKMYYASIFLKPLVLLWNAVIEWYSRNHEDVFWTSIAARLIPGFKVPPVQVALDFAFEEHPQKCLEMNGGKLPFGCHAWEKFDTDFWRPHFAKYGYTI